MANLTGLKDWVEKAYLSFVAIFDAVQSIEDSVKESVERLKDIKEFEPNLDWKTRVISVPKIFDHYQELRETLLTGLKDKFDTIVSDMHIITSALKKPPKVDPDIGRVVGTFLWAENLLNALLALQNALKTLMDITVIIDDLKKSVESLDILFLSQKNPKFRETGPHRARRKQLTGA